MPPRRHVPCLPLFRIDTELVAPPVGAPSAFQRLGDRLRGRPFRAGLVTDVIADSHANGQHQNGAGYKSPSAPSHCLPCLGATGTSCQRRDYQNSQCTADALLEASAAVVVNLNVAARQHTGARVVTVSSRIR